MNEMNPGKTQGAEKQARPDGAARTETAESKSVLDGLQRLGDGELHEVVKCCGEILAAREKERRDNALLEIQKIASEYGLTVNVKGTAVKRRKARRAKTK
jgi:hypothetical protein